MTTSGLYGGGMDNTFSNFNNRSGLRSSGGISSDPAVGKNDLYKLFFYLLDHVYVHRSKSRRFRTKIVSARFCQQRNS